MVKTSDNICGDKVHCGQEEPCCRLEKGHPVVGFNNGQTRKYRFHRGDGWVWDDSCAWREDQAPKEG